MKNVTKITVRYAETDQMGVVHHSNYLVWFEVGRTNFMKQAGYDYATLEANNILSPVIDAHVQYHKPARYGEEVEIVTTLQQYNGIRMTYYYEIYNEAKEKLVSGTTTHTIVKKDTFKPVRLRTVAPDWHKKYAAMMKEVH